MHTTEAALIDKQAESPTDDLKRAAERLAHTNLEPTMEKHTKEAEKGTSTRMQLVSDLTMSFAHKLWHWSHASCQCLGFSAPPANPELSANGPSTVSAFAKVLATCGGVMPGQAASEQVSPCAAKTHAGASASGTTCP